MIDDTGSAVRGVWYDSPEFRRVALALFGVMLVVSSIQGIFQRDNDFLVHYVQGTAARDGQLYLNNTQYLPGRQMLNAVVAWPPYRVSRAIVYILALVSLLVVLRTWNQIADRHWPAPRSRRFAATAFALGLCLHYLWRDLDDAGLQILLLLMLTCGASALMRGKTWQTGAWLAAAASYKTPAILFLPYLLYKRRWPEVLHLLMFLVLINVVLPASLFGVQETARGWSAFLAMNEAVLFNSDPSLNPVEPPKHQNQSLTFSLARLVQHYEPGHPLAPSPDTGPRFFIQVLSLDPGQARIVVSAAVLLLAAVLAWRWRRPWSTPATDPGFPAEWATVTTLCALLSPLCWMHHLVLVLPAVLLVLRAQLGHPQPRWRRVIVGYVTVTMVVLVYDLLTRQGWMIVIANGVHTWACLGVLWLVQTLPPSPVGGGVTQA